MLHNVAIMFHSVTIMLHKVTIMFYNFVMFHIVTVMFPTVAFMLYNVAIWFLRDLLYFFTNNKQNKIINSRTILELKYTWKFSDFPFK